MPEDRGAIVQLGEVIRPFREFLPTLYVCTPGRVSFEDGSFNLLRMVNWGDVVWSVRPILSFCTTL